MGSALKPIQQQNAFYVLTKANKMVIIFTMLISTDTYYYLLERIRTFFSIGNMVLKSKPVLYTQKNMVLKSKPVLYTQKKTLAPAARPKHRVQF